MKQAGQISLQLLIGLGVVGTLGLAGAAVLTLGSDAPASPDRQSADAPVQDVLTTNTENDPAKMDNTETADLSNAPERPEMPKVIEWQGHYLVLQGENHLPVKQARATPFVTFYEVEAGYMPVSGNSDSKVDTVCGEKPAETVEAGMRDAAAVSMADEAAAIAGANYGANQDRRPDYCPQDLGQIWGSGSYVYDGDYNQLAGQDFSESARIMKAARLWFEEDFERTHGDPEEDEVIVILEGGDDRAGDPAIKIANFYNSIIIDYPVLKPEADDPDGPVQGPGGTYAPPAPELPVTVFNRALTPSDFDPNIYQVPIDLIEDRIEETVSETSIEFGPLGDIIVVTRNVRFDNKEEGRERARRIQDALQAAYGSGVNVQTLSFGDEVPICRDDSRECWSMNRSTIAYLYRQ
ncbi:MAG: hypothetical protein AAGK93_08185 [Pseudomonadota bacterium]